MAAHDEKSAELSRYKLSRLTNDDADAYHRVGCPAVAGKLRCPLRPALMARPHHLPEILEPPAIPPPCCTKQSLTVPPAVNAKTAQAHDYPSSAWRSSYARRSAAEHSNSRPKDPAGINLDVRGQVQAPRAHPAGAVPRVCLRDRGLRPRRRLRGPPGRGRPPQQPTTAETAKATPENPRRPCPDRYRRTPHSRDQSRRRARHQVSATRTATRTSASPAGRCSRATPRHKSHTPARRWRRHKREHRRGPNVKTSRWAVVTRTRTCPSCRSASGPCSETETQRGSGV